MSCPHFLVGNYSFASQSPLLTVSNSDWFPLANRAKGCRDENIVFKSKHTEVQFLLKNISLKPKTQIPQFSWNRLNEYSLGFVLKLLV